jgi:GWxTD domain-containing protein
MRLSLFLPALILMTSGVAADPAQLIAAARARLAAGDCEGSTAGFDAARREAAALVDPGVRLDALGAAHFYSAVTFSHCGDEARARAELKEFFRIKPGASTLDPAKYAPRFIRLFAEVQELVTPTRAATFARFYPGFDQSAASTYIPLPTHSWGASSEFLLLATDEERDRWGRLRDDMERAEFISRFWGRRDPTPETADNEIRGEMGRRVKFADRIFPAADERGALTDRGRVFVLLGPPSRVYRESLQRGQTTFVTRSVRRPLDGQMERWIYFRPQLPASVPASQVEFRFITQPGYGEAVMQKEFMPLKALEQARKAVLLLEE